MLAEVAPISRAWAAEVEMARLVTKDHLVVLNITTCLQEVEVFGDLVAVVSLVGGTQAAREDSLNYG